MAWVERNGRRAPKVTSGKEFSGKEARNFLASFLSLSSLHLIGHRFICHHRQYQPVFFYDEDQEDAHMGDGRLIPLTTCYLKKATTGTGRVRRWRAYLSTHSLQTSERSVLLRKLYYSGPSRHTTDFFFSSTHSNLDNLKDMF
jgi:hypothetical protein